MFRHFKTTEGIYRMEYKHILQDEIWIVEDNNDIMKLFMFIIQGKRMF